MPRDPDEILKVEEERSLRGELNSTAFSLEFLLITSEVSAPFEELVYTSEHGLEVSMAWVLVLYMVKFLGEWNLIWSALKMLPSEKSQSGHNLLCFTYAHEIWCLLISQSVNPFMVSFSTCSIQHLCWHSHLLLPFLPFLCSKLEPCSLSPPRYWVLHNIVLTDFFTDLWAPATAWLSTLPWNLPVLFWLTAIPFLYSSYSKLYHPPPTCYSTPPHERSTSPVAFYFPQLYLSIYL